MQTNLKKLADKLNLLADSIDKKVSEIAIDTALNIVTTLAYKTPVDTSQALSNWQVGINVIENTFISPYVPGVLGYTLSQSAQQTIAVATAKLKNKKPGETIYISNNAPYIRALNNGSSKQAPAGFVEIAVLKARKEIKPFKL